MLVESAPIRVAAPFSLPIEFEIYRALEVVYPSNKRRRKAFRIECRFYSTYIRRVLKLTESAQKSLKMPRCFELPPVMGPFTYTDVINSAKRLLDDFVSGERHPYEEIAQCSSLSTNDGASALLGHEPGGHESLVVEQAGTPSTEIVVNKRQESVTGRLLSSGRDIRTIDKESFNNFFIEIAMDDLDNAEQKLFGEDLQRALQKSGAHVGDRIEIKFNGWIPVPVPGKHGVTTTKRKKSFTIKRI